MTSRKVTFDTAFVLLTERRDNLDAVCSEYFEAFTILSGLGYWRGAGEESATIIIVTDDRRAVYSLAESIKARNGQDSVLVIELPAVSILV